MTVPRTLFAAFLALFAFPVLGQDAQKIQSESNLTTPSLLSETGAEVACAEGMAGQFPCENISMTAFLSLADIIDAVNAVNDPEKPPPSQVNDLWGWTDPESGIEYAIVGMNSGAVFLDLALPENPRILGFLPTHTNASTWRDIRVYNDYAFIVADGASDHGMQIFDLTQLRTITEPILFEESSHYDGIASAHNLSINVATGYGYIVGSSGGGQTCNSSLHMVDLSTPLQPTFAGCFFDLKTGGIVRDGYTHDVQCVVYSGPDSEHVDKEICIGSNETAISIADVTDKENPMALSRGTYPSAGYIHQGWITEDHRYFYQDDELDEAQTSTGTITYIWDLNDLDDPILIGELNGPHASIDHNQFIRGNFLYQSNYSSGITIWDIRDVNDISIVGTFDTYPLDNDAHFGGSWGNYPFFDSGYLVATSRGEGVFVLNPQEALLTSVEKAEIPSSLSISSLFPNPAQDQTRLIISSQHEDRLRIELVDMTGKIVGIPTEKAVSAASTVEISLDTSHLPNGNYLVRVSGNSETKVHAITILD